jgi:hypothetical protein
VQPDRPARADVRDRRYRIDAGARRGAHGGHDRERHAPGRAIGIDRRGEPIGTHPELRVRRDAHDGVVTEAEKNHRFVDR